MLTTEALIAEIPEGEEGCSDAWVSCGTDESVPVQNRTSEDARV
jgi:hypothetical protein